MPRAPAASSSSRRPRIRSCSLAVASRCQHRSPGASVAGEHLDPGGRPGGGVPIVQGPALDARLGIRRRHGHRAHLQLESGRDAVERLQSVTPHGLRVAVQVDEPRSDHAPRGIEDDVPAQVGADRRDAGPVDRKVRRRVEALAGIDHASAADHHLEVDHAPGLRRARRRNRAAWANGRHAREQKAPPIQRRETDERAAPLTSQVL